MTEIQYEYTTGTCDVWQLGHLANFFADKRWEPVFAVEAQRGIKVSSHVGDENGGSYEALKPYEVLFRRVLKTEEDDGYPSDEAMAAIAAACTCPGCMTGGKCVDDQPDDNDGACVVCLYDFCRCTDEEWTDELDH